MFKKVKGKIVNTIKIFKHETVKDFWKNYKPDLKKTHQEIACYSHEKDVQECIDKTHTLLQETFNKYLTIDRASILDIGCGPGLYLKDFPPQHYLSGIDINLNMLALAKNNVPQAEFFNGDFLEYLFDKKFDLIYSIGVIQYVNKEEIQTFFDKIASLLNPGGLVFISYPHALSENDILQPDKNFIHYSPDFLNKIISEKFILLQNKHIYDGRKITDFDRNPYKPLNPSFDRTYKNSSILIAKKIIPPS